MSKDNQEIEQEIQAKNLTAPRVTPQRVEEVQVAVSTTFSPAPRLRCAA